MAPILFMVLVLAGASADTADLPWQDLALTIEKDRSTSSDTVTLCRVRVVNRGSHTWPGRLVRFEAAAIDAGVAMVREKGRFGLSLRPHETLETMIAFEGLYDRFEVRLLSRDPGDRGSKSGRSGREKGANKKRRSGGR